MKKIIVPFFVLILLSSIVVAQQYGVNGETGRSDSEVEPGSQGEGTGQQPVVIAPISQKTEVKAKNTTELRQMIQQRQEEMNQEMESLGKGSGHMEILQNQNKVRLAVHTLLSMEDLVGGIGKNVSQIAKEFNNSVQATIRSEERIQTRNILTKFLLGGDEEAATEMEQEVNRNQIGIQELKQLMQECDCDQEVKEMLQEQIQNMEEEQNRLQQLAQNEKQNKGLFGWLFR